MTDVTENLDTAASEPKLSLAEEMHKNYLAMQEEKQAPANDDLPQENVADDDKDLPAEPSPEDEQKPKPVDKPAEAPKDAKQPKTDFQAPAHLDKQGREALAKIQDPALKQQLTASLERMAKNAQRVQQQAQEAAKQWSAINSVFEPHRATLQAQGMNEIAATKRLIEIHDYASKNPAEYIKWFANEAGIDLAKFAAPAQAQQAQPEQDQEYLTPAEKRALDEAEKLRQELNTLKQNFTADYSSRQQQTVQQTIESFRTATNPDGGLKHPHFDRFKELMAPMVSNGMSLEDAYKRVYEQTVAPFEANLKQQQKREVAQKAVVSGKRLRSTVPAAQSGKKMTIAEEMYLRSQGQL